MNDRELDALVAEKYQSGMTLEAIGRLIGRTTQAVRYRLKRLGITCRSNSESHMGQPAWNNKGGHVDPQGYRCLWRDGRQVREHRVVAEKMLGRKLRHGEVVHHKNGIRTDNRPENLEVMPSHSHHMKEHMTTAEAKWRAHRTLVSCRKAALKAVGVAAPGESKEEKNGIK